MFNINDVLNNVIAVVVVILILSLVVQSVQSVLKKFFKIKSRQIEESLVDLFKNVLEKPEEELKGLDKLIDHAPICRILFFWRDRRSAAEIAGVKDIYEHVVEEFRKIGRVAQSGKHMLDSIAKDDLLKVLGKAPVAELLPNFPGRVASAIAQIQALE